MGVSADNDGDDAQQVFQVAVEIFGGYHDTDAGRYQGCHLQQCPTGRPAGLVPDRGLHLEIRRRTDRPQQGGGIEDSVIEVQVRQAEVLQTEG